MKKELIPAARIAQSIHFLRGQKVMLDFDLAAFYGVAAKVLNQAVKRNRDRFPDDFMFRLTVSETSHLRSQFVISSEQSAGNEPLSSKYRGQVYRPYAFTEQGVAMLSSVLKSDRAGERTRLACWRWRPRHRELVPKRRTSTGTIRLRESFSARHRKQHARRVCSPIRIK